MIRPATSADLDRVLSLGEAMHAESVYCTLYYNRTKGRKELEWTLKNGFFHVLEVNGQIEGMMTGYVKAPYYSDDLIGFEELLYLSPKHRHGRNAARLIQAWSEHCINKGAVLLKPSTACGDFSGDRLYEAMGFTRVGSSFVKVIK